MAEPSPTDKVVSIRKATAARAYAPYRAALAGLNERVALFGHLGGTPVPPDNSKRPPWK